MVGTGRPWTGPGPFVLQVGGTGSRGAARSVRPLLLPGAIRRQARNLRLCSDSLRRLTGGLTMHRGAAGLLILFGCSAWLPGLIPVGRAVDPFGAFVLPESTLVNIGAVAEVSLSVDGSSHQFNGYEVTIQYDPRILSSSRSCRGRSCSTPARTGSIAVTTTDSTVSYVHIVLCDGVSLDGPGALSLFRFNADSIGVSPLRITSPPDLTFFDDGLYVAPDHPSYPRQVVLFDGVIEVWDPTTSDVPRFTGAARSGPGLPVRLWPNPIEETTAIRVELNRDGPLDLAIFDAGGRRVWRRTMNAAGAGVSRCRGPA